MSIDLRSDTVTRPTDEMLKAMIQAEVGNDMFGEDPTVNRVEKSVAGLFGMEGGLFVPSGTLGNQLSLKVLTEPGDEVLIEQQGHIFNYETSAAAAISSVQLQTVKGKRGKLTTALLKDRIRGENLWEPRTSVIAIENTTNKGGGACYVKEELQELREFADEHAVSIHLDGARIWNAITATNITPSFFGSVADTINVCFSKGLGAPIGSMVLSSKANIQKARRYRKMLGGALCQAGVLAAAADYAIKHHWPNLKYDHYRAKKLAKTIEECSKLSIDLDAVETNILIFELLEEEASSALDRLGKKSIQVTPFGPRTLRAVFHHHITDQNVEEVQQGFKELFD